MRVLSLFSGGGLGDYGLELAGMEIVGQVEINDYCQKILKLRWPDVPKWTDIKNVTGKEILKRVGAIDLISGGFPCQPFSTAGTRSGENDRRHLWPEMCRIICEVRPRWVLAENVPGLLSISNGRVFGKVVRDLAESGYCVKWDCIPASAIGAPHQRDRVWIMGYATGKRLERHTRTSIQRNRIRSSRASQSMADSERVRELQSQGSKQKKRRRIGNESENVAYSEGAEQPRIWGTPRNGRDKFRRSSWWKTEPNVGRVAHGVANRVDRLKLLGNGQVVQVVEWIGEQIMKFNVKELEKP